MSPIRVVVTPMPLLKEHTHVATTIAGRLSMMSPANRRINDNPIVRFV